MKTKAEDERAAAAAAAVSASASARPVAAAAGETPTTKLWELVLSKAEIEALESLATNSAVEAERGLLGKLKLLKREAEVADRLASERMREREMETEMEEVEVEMEKSTMNNMEERCGDLRQ